MNPFRSACFTGSLALLLAGCATPEKRIQQNQDVFDTFPVAAQARIRAASDIWLSRRKNAARLSQRYDIVAVLPFTLPRHFPDAF